jgi:hypothetical protein
MEKFDVVIGLERLADARAKWNKGRREFDTGYYRVLARLVHEGARAYMSDREMAKALGVTTAVVRNFMRSQGLGRVHGKRALSEAAAKALRENAALLGVKPHEMDLTSPLAYLPMGSDLRSQLQDQTTAQVVDEEEAFPETDLDAIERWADDHFTQGEVAVVLRLVEEFGWKKP